MQDSTSEESLFLGLMSGTSMDGIDAALFAFGDRSCETIAYHSATYPAELRTELLTASRNPTECTIDIVGNLDRWVGECFRDAAIELLTHAKIDPKSVSAIGSHGQTLRHQPRATKPFTVQIGDPNTIVAGTGITTVADFRRRDLALGGEGAPLAPAFHHWLFSSPEAERCVLNLGGFANVTVLPKKGKSVVGFDTGPANTLLDSWIRKHQGKPFDENGDWARSGNIIVPVLDEMLHDPYFAMPAPKSTGFEHFNDNWIAEKLAGAKHQNPAAEDMQSTLAELSARTIADAVLQITDNVSELLLCGGGVYNSDLLDRIERNLPQASIETTDSYGLHPDWVEAAAFAWLAKQCIEGKPGNLPSVTGATHLDVLGAIYPRKA